MGFLRRLIYGGGVVYELGRAFIIAVIILILIHYFAFTVFVVSGPSMEPNFHDKQVVLINRFNLFTNNFDRGEPMVLKFPGDPEHKKYIKRLIGLPGDTVELKNGHFYINGQRLYESYIADEIYTEPANSQTIWKLSDGEYFLSGDNRPNSSDSRHWGVAKRSDMIGPVKMILFPFSHFQFVSTPPYDLGTAK